ncbi:MAG: heterocyst frequency control protein PatD [Pegethrix bostrychoides GSE-TBD4-15B]|jgi:hypothetical protein|uniref:Heterocyst frequency control protein PatD n=1 Tax=Pegethrix bostrychoides GSE-TBD4-15B TaxID=2839662 RepID=A0A951PBH3_9CYAN|nr:heterocyst frequency control protein PatD [Pegethrix bostrychoides GSE-TBD4-15B]
MSASSYQTLYQQAQVLLQAMLSDSTEPQLRAKLATHLPQLQRLFQQSLPTEISAENNLSEKLQPLQIEINKQMRLLETDAVFLKAARQPATIEQRCQQIRTRVSLLLRYCEAILQLCTDSGDSSSDHAR